MYLHNNTVYPTAAALLAALDKDAGSEVPASARKLTVVFPPLDDIRQCHVFEGGKLDAAKITYTLAIRDYSKEERDAVRSHLKKTGLEYADTGVIVPFASADALALLQVRAAFETGVVSTVIQFSNGAKQPMTAQQFPAFAGWFVQNRNRFYQD